MSLNIPARNVVPWPMTTAGPAEAVARIRVGWRERLRLRAGPLAVGSALLLADAVLRGPRLVPFVLYLLGVFLLGAVPIHYTLTDRGLQLGGGGFRYWTEFAGVSASHGQIRLQPVGGGHLVTLRLSRAQAAELEPVVRRWIWASYRGAEPRRPMVLQPQPHRRSA